MTLTLGRQRLWTAGAGIIAVGVVLLAGVLLRDLVPPADAWLLDHAAAASGSAAATLATAISGGGTLLCLAGLIGAAAAVWWRGRAGSAGFLLRSLAVGLLCASLLFAQELIQRPGPPLQPEAGTYPSGHATIVSAAAVTAVVLCRSLGRTWGRTALAVGLAAVVLVSGSRVVLGEHWLVDVVAAVVGTVGVGLLAGAALRVLPRHGYPSTQ